MSQRQHASPQGVGEGWGAPQGPSLCAQPSALKVKDRAAQVVHGSLNLSLKWLPGETAESC